MPRGKKASKEECAPAKAKSPLKIKTLRGSTVNAHHINRMKLSKNDGSFYYRYFLVSSDGKSSNTATAEKALNSGLKIHDVEPKAKKERNPKTYRGKDLKTAGQITRLVNRRRNSCMKRCEEDSVSLSESLSTKFGNLPSSPPRERKSSKKAESEKPAKKKAAAKPKSKTAAAKKSAANANKGKVSKAKETGKPRGRPPGSKNKK
jgi:hypothetical protein